MTFRSLDRWRLPQLILGTCNEIELIKNTLMEELGETLIKEYPSMAGRIKKEVVKEL